MKVGLRLFEIMSDRERETERERESGAQLQKIENQFVMAKVLLWLAAKNKQTHMKLCITLKEKRKLRLNSQWKTDR